MTGFGAGSDCPLGFLTVVEDQKHGLFGGYLVLNRAGRPLEFHCTAPIRPNRAQEILYGPTLRPYLYGEQIGRTLLEQGKHPAAVVLTDCEPMLAVGEFISLPVILVGGGALDAQPLADHERENAGGQKWRIDRAETAEPKLRFFETGGQRFAVRRDANFQEEEAVLQRIGAVAASLDLSEPFDRIRAAIEEARRGGQ
jgi:hypothetical protein